MLHGDCLEWLKEIEDNSVDLLLTDPPYFNVVKAEWDKTNPFSVELVNEFHRVLKPTGNVYVWCGIGEKSRSLLDFIPKLDSQFYFKDLITWKKDRGIGMRKGWLYTREECLWYVKDNKQFNWNKEEQYLIGETRKRDRYGLKDGQNGKPPKSEYKRITNVWVDISEQDYRVHKEYGHLTPKPLKAIERIIKTSSNEGDIVLDCFLGSGTTAVACINTNRNFIGIEKEWDYCEIANKRIEEAKKTKTEL